MTGERFPPSGGLVSPSALADARAAELEHAQAEQFLTMCRVAPDDRGPHRGWYVLGSYDESVTIYRQQVRAMNLIHALSSEQGIDGATIAIVGGGVSGVTAAVAAALAGAKVSLFERSPQLIALQARASHRFVHPRLYEWPETDRDESDSAGLPFLSWQAGPAAEVVDGMRREFERWRVTLGINVITGTAVSRVDPEGATWRIGLQNARLDPPHSFAQVIFAVGFGLERAAVPAAKRDFTAPYWFPDALERARHECEPPSAVTVVGGGDGGLIDAVRAAISVSHEDLFRRVFASPMAAQLAVEMREIDKGRDADREGKFGKKDTSEPYYALWARAQATNEQLGLDALQSGARVCLVTNGTNAYALNTALVNRLLVLCLSRLGRIEWVHGELESVSSTDENRHQVIVRDPVAPPFDAPDVVLVRVGPDRRCLDESIPGLHGGTFRDTTAPLDTAHLKNMRGKYHLVGPDARAFFERCMVSASGAALQRSPNSAAAATPDAMASERTGAAPVTTAELVRGDEVVDGWSARGFLQALARLGRGFLALFGRAESPTRPTADDPETAPVERPDVRPPPVLLAVGKRVRLASPVVCRADGRVLRLHAADGNHGNIASVSAGGVSIVMDGFTAATGALRQVAEDRVEPKYATVPGGHALTLPGDLLGSPWPDATDGRLVHLRVTGIVRWEGSRWVVDVE